MHIDCVSFIKFTIFMKRIFSSPTNTGSPNQIQRWPSENWGTHTEIVSFGNVLLLFISLRLRGNTSDQPGLSNTPWYYFFFCLLISVVNIYYIVLHRIQLYLSWKRNNLQHPVFSMLMKGIWREAVEKLLTSELCCSYCTLWKLLCHPFHCWCAVDTICILNIKKVFSHLNLINVL